MPDPISIRRLYGRAKGHKLRQGQAALVEEMLPQLSVPETGPLDAQTLFGDAEGSGRPLEFEIGFGGGEHLAGQAAMRPDHGFIGCEPFLNGVVGALNHIRDDKLANVRLHMGDALDVLERLPDASLDRLYLLHPDPWPKARHAKRRMVNNGPLDMIAAKLKPGAEFRLGTDDPTYCRWSMMVMNQRRDFVWQAKSAADFLTRPTDWPETRYERKARRQGHEVWYFRYRRI
ncbi:tRNA (guanine-N7-)-methyltransferase [Sphingomonas naasensis]|uniref:tRNA (guanine-N(7)-)-methyltransferase n=1 Tax=Sphingomonas naasensis TaxID=1344951 RepID=A0A4S1W6J2_9SPHN|nr:tRNA (guanine(46)-N(7))-methyltransferase TrmB [Sphingomonas naasensis]NIJ20005.1 tRNA (guanine-N7-)-methyltransferase [Sphingomonas naasensis]TGX37953.1 tRNA (guanosine(46)-N7)-methyltransferase TrmB [Sphingomonas naasensis]